DLGRPRRRQPGGQRHRQARRAHGRLAALRAVRRVLQDSGLHHAQVSGRDRLRYGALSAVLVLRLGRRHLEGGRLVVPHRRQLGARRIPEPAGRLRAVVGVGLQADVAEGRGRLGQEPGTAARVLPLAAIRGGRHRRRRHQQLERTLRAAARARAKTVLDHWVGWVKQNVKLRGDGTYDIPSTLDWSGKPAATSNAGSHAAGKGWNAGLHVKIRDFGDDAGVASALARTLAFYAAKAGDRAAQKLAKELLDRM